MVVEIVATSTALLLILQSMEVWSSSSTATHPSYSVTSAKDSGIKEALSEARLAKDVYVAGVVSGDMVGSRYATNT